jgi:hypothetical protein
MCLTVDASLLAAIGFGSTREFHSAVFGCPIHLTQGTYVRADRGDNDQRSAATEPEPTRSSPVPSTPHEAG